MDNLAMWSLVVGFFTPPVLAVIQQPKWSATVRAIVGFLFALVVGGVTAWLTGSLNVNDWVSAALIVLVSAITTYKGFWKETGVAQKIEAATSAKETPSE